MSNQERSETAGAKALQVGLRTSEARGLGLTALRIEVSRLLALPLVQVTLGVLLLAAFAQVVIPLPFTPVPLTLSTLAAMALGLWLGPKRGMAAAALYATLGAAGLPIFAGFKSGALSVGFGYILGYIAAAGIVGVLLQKSSSYLRGLLVAFLASAAVYLFGATWMVLFFGVPASAVVALGVLPFLFGDLLKALVIAGLAKVSQG